MCDVILSRKNVYNTRMECVYEWECTSVCEHLWARYKMGTKDFFLEVFIIVAVTDD